MPMRRRVGVGLEVRVSERERRAEVDVGALREIAVAPQPRRCRTRASARCRVKTSECPPKTSPVASRNRSRFGISFETDSPASEMPSSPPTRLRVTSGRSVHGRTCVCIVFTLPNCPRILPPLTSRPPGRLVNVMNPSSTSAPSGPTETKKSPRA